MSTASINGLPLVVVVKVSGYLVEIGSKMPLFEVSEELHGANDHCVVGIGIPKTKVHRDQMTKMSPRKSF